jgi:pSer/pThr/pTyr-binding forkhead associated (FHA) protein
MPVREQSSEHSADAARTANQQRREAPFGAPHVFVLVAVDGEDPSLAHRLTRPETSIGRGSECHLSIEDDQVSRLHCSIQVDGPVCAIVDSGSRNGTRVNGRRIQQGVKLRLRHLDEIEVGTHRLLLLSGRFRSRPEPDAA